MEAVNGYRLPVRKEDIVKTVTESPTHKGKLRYGIDFLFTEEIGDYSVEGKPVFAACDGTVFYVRDGSGIGGPKEEFMFKGNVVIIEHPNKEFSLYDHLKKGIVVRVGDKVKAETMIGYSGNTGYTFLSHLHFDVRRFTGPNREEDFETLYVKFKN